MADKEIDCKGLMCPMPIVQLSNASKQMNSGQTIRITADDKAFRSDVEAWCKQTGNELQSVQEEDGKVKADIKLK